MQPDIQTNIHDAKIDPRNLNILISVNGKLVPRAEAMISVFDSGFILGDGVWKGLRLVKGTVHTTDHAWKAPDAPRPPAAS
jgi:branched-chain amino acid aminotransferase